MSPDDIIKAKGYLKQAESEYIEVMIQEELAQCRYASAMLLYYLEFSIYMLNKKYIKYGIKRIPQEMSEMSILPEGFLSIHHAIACAETLSQIKASCTAFIKATRQCFKDIEHTPQAKVPITAESLVGTYEEIHSNWRSKMYHSIDIESPYLSLSTMTSCQYFYNTMAERYCIPPISIMQNFDPSNLTETAAHFDRAMSKYLELYNQMGVKLKKYDTIEEFIGSYLSSSV